MVDPAERLPEWVSWETLTRWAFEPGVVLLGPGLADLDPRARHHIVAMLDQVGDRVGVEFGAVLRSGDVVCLTVSADGMGENIAAGPC